MPKYISNRAFEYIRAFRELYEAFVISSFVYYIIELLGGEDQLALTLRTKDAKYGRHVFIFKYICREWQLGRSFMINCKYGVVSLYLVYATLWNDVALRHAFGLAV